MRFRNIIIFVLLFIFTGCFSIKQPLKTGELNTSNEIEGEWYGFAKQFNNNSTWDVKIKNKRGTYNIEYPSLKCKGTLTLIEAYPQKLVFKEKITFGKEKCIDNGTTIIKKTSPYTAEYLWYYLDNKFGAIGKLKKSK